MQRHWGEKHPHLDHSGLRPFFSRRDRGMGTVLGTYFSVVLTCLTILTARRLICYRMYFNLGFMMVFFTILITFFCTLFLIILVFLTILVFLMTLVFGTFTVLFLITILVTDYFSFLRIVFVAVNVLVSYFIYFYIFFYFCNTNLLIIFFIGLKTYCFLFTVFISQRVLFLSLFLSSV